jgi:hypothetical protein
LSFMKLLKSLVYNIASLEVLFLWSSSSTLLSSLFLPSPSFC